ncbi:hypothetical protein SAMN06297387_11223 [Streptomyces zhaozhouensis]|uniref:Helix-turn-helix domain-containing protein n=1 Tax=Streptomyces zhaozhouensis TaxID=1300267 RepID=A0A286DYH0_9ACTN|nr:DNA-binding protein [Streptomyces zhaozhouensis]SOD63670.1 hypothetical protein SAMN06297387_11223 [Streptomyces zhaozhouensis]
MPKEAAAELLTPKQVCEEYPALFINPQSLAERRWRGTGPAYIKTSPSRAGRVYYRRGAIEAWLDDQTVLGGAAA